MQRGGYECIVFRFRPSLLFASEAIRYATAAAAIDHKTGPRPQLRDAPGENRHALARGLQLRACLCPSHSSSEWQGKGYHEREYSTTKCMSCIRHRHRCSRSRGLNRHSSVCTAPRHASRTTTIPTCKCIRGPLPQCLRWDRSPLLGAGGPLFGHQIWHRSPSSSRVSVQGAVKSRQY